ncbi:hypothetical protein RRG08_002010 [Elysia crispata]|uniref:Uncharacterized protein n=1 Tax=Elysia crispata TaxID=231223 RepID=A0AAE1AV72_9GAST|nr:hypothetical protein RRG08_002010 [Elysia crispata]
MINLPHASLGPKPSPYKRRSRKDLLVAYTLRQVEKRFVGGLYPEAGSRKDLLVAYTLRQVEKRFVGGLYPEAGREKICWWPIP